MNKEGGPKSPQQLAAEGMRNPQLFKCSWRGADRVPPEVTLPNGKVAGIGYMRDGNIQLILGDEVIEATYERIESGIEEGWNAIHITYDADVA